METSKFNTLNGLNLVLSYFGLSLRGRKFWNSYLFLFFASICLAMTLLWPILSSQYQLGGGASHEILLYNGLRSAFNQQLLNGSYPLWNDAVGNGKPFLFWGSTLINYLTPIELLAGGQVTVGIYKLEVVIVYVAVALGLFLLARFLGMPRWTVVPAFYACFLVGSMTNLSHWIPWSSIIIFGSCAIACIIFFFVDGRKRWLLSYICSVVFLTLGVRLDALPMFLIFTFSLVAARGLETALRRRSVQWILSTETLRNLIMFCVLPIGLFAWQIPLIINLLSVADDRLAASTFTIFESSRHVITAIAMSSGTFYVLFCPFILFLIKRLLTLQTRVVSGISTASAVKKNLKVLFWVAGIALILLTLNIQELEMPPSKISWWIILLSFFIALVLKTSISKKRSKISEPNSLAHLTTFRALLVSSALGGIHCILFEDMPQTGEYLGISVEVKSIFLLLLFYGIVSGLSSKSRKVEQAVKWVLVCFSIGWIWRDILCIPLSEYANILWVTRAEIFWYIPSIAILIMVGAGAIAKDLKHVLPQFTIVAKGQPLKVTALSIPLLLVSYGFYLYVDNILLAFYVDEGIGHQNAIWQHMNPTDVKRVVERQNRIVEIAKKAKVGCGEEGRILTQALDMSAPDPLPDIGYPGALAGQGVKDAWSHDFNNRYYRKLAEQAFVDVKLPPNYGEDYEPVPRLFMYNAAARRVYTAYGDSFYGGAEKSIKGVWADWTRNLLLASGKAIDPLFLQLMRVCHIVTAAGPLQNHPALERTFDDDELWDGKETTYNFSNDRRLGNYAFLPGDGLSQAQLIDLSNSSRNAIKKLISEMSILPVEKEADGIHVAELYRAPNHFTLEVKSDKAGYLFIFKSWNPGWTGFLNKNKIDIQRALITYGVVRIPGGTSTLELRFWPKFFMVGICISVMTLIIIIIMGARLSFRKLIFS